MTAAAAPGRGAVFLLGCVLLCGCLLSDHRKNAVAGLGPLAPYSYEPIGAGFLLPNTVLDQGSTLPYAPGFKPGRHLRNGNDNPYLSIRFYLADQYRDWLGRSEYIETGMGPVDSSEIMLADRSGRRYEHTAALALGREEHQVRIIRVVLPANERLFVFEATIDESGFRDYHDAFESMVASIRIDPSTW